MAPGMGDFARTKFNSLGQPSRPSTPDKAQLDERRQIAQNAKLPVVRRAPGPSGRSGAASIPPTGQISRTDAFDTDSEAADETTVGSIHPEEHLPTRPEAQALQNSVNNSDFETSDQATEMIQRPAFSIASHAKATPQFGPNYGLNDPAFNRILEGMSWNRFGPDFTMATNASYPTTTSGRADSSEPEPDEEEESQADLGDAPLQRLDDFVRGTNESSREHPTKRTNAQHHDMYRRQQTLGERGISEPNDARLISTRGGDGRVASELPDQPHVDYAPAVTRPNNSMPLQNQAMRPHQQGRWQRPPDTAQSSIVPTKRIHSQIGTRQETTGQSPRGPSLDYDPVQLKQLPYEQLHDQDFDLDPTVSSSTAREVSLNEPLESRLKKFMGKSGDSQAAFFRSLNIADWEQSGDWLLERFADVIKRYTESRKRKREVSRAFEEEVYKRHETVQWKKATIEDALRGMRSSGKGLLAATPGR